jgi:hypothetical protein
MKKADNFNPGKWLVENKITTQSRLNEVEVPSNLNPITKKKFDNLLAMAEKAVANKDKETLYKIYNKGLYTGSNGWSYFIDSLVDKGLASIDDRGMLNWNFEESPLNEEENTDIVSFLESNRQELINKLAKKFRWDEDDIEDMDIEGQEIGIGSDDDGNDDEEIAVLGEAGYAFSFNPSKVKDTYGDADEFKLVIAGKPVYGLAYNA